MNSQLIESFFKFCPQCAAANHQLGSVPFRCAQCGFANFFGPVSAVAALVTNDDNQLLLVRRARDPGKGRWGLPGGFVDREETIEEALGREVLEETSLRVVAAQYLMSHPNHYDYRGMISPVIDLFFCCQVNIADPISLAPDELDDHRWMRPTDAYLDQMAFHSNRVAVEYWLTLES